MFRGLVVHEILRTSEGLPTLIALQRFGMVAVLVIRPRARAEKLIPTSSTPYGLVHLLAMALETDELSVLISADVTLVTF